MNSRNQRTRSKVAVLTITSDLLAGGGGGGGDASFR